MWSPSKYQDIILRTRKNSDKIHVETQETNSVLNNKNKSKGITVWDFSFFKKMIYLFEYENYKGVGCQGEI